MLRGAARSIAQTQNRHKPTPCPRSSVGANYKTGLGLAGGRGCPERRIKAWILDLFVHDMGLAVQQFLPHPFIEFLVDKDRSIGRSASSHSTSVPMCRPKSAGSGPSAGKMCTRKSAMSRRHWVPRMCMPLGLSICMQRRRVRARVHVGHHRHPRRKGLMTAAEEEETAQSGRGQQGDTSAPHTRAGRTMS
jgi:hypothetical protein